MVIVDDDDDDDDDKHTCRTLKRTVNTQRNVICSRSNSDDFRYKKFIDIFVRVFFKTFAKIMCKQFLHWENLRL